MSIRARNSLDLDILEALFKNLNVRFALHASVKSNMTQSGNPAEN